MWSSDGMYMVKWRYLYGQVTACIWSNDGIYMVKWRHAHGQMAVFIWSSDGMYMVKWRYLYGQVTACTWSNGGIYMVKWRHVYGQMTVFCLRHWSKRIAGCWLLTCKMKILDFALATNFDAQKLRRFVLLAWQQTNTQRCETLSAWSSGILNLYKPCVLYIGRTYRYPQNVAFYIFFQQI